MEASKTLSFTGETSKRAEATIGGCNLEFDFYFLEEKLTRMQVRVKKKRESGFSHIGSLSYDKTSDSLTVQWNGLSFLTSDSRKAIYSFVEDSLAEYLTV